MDPPFLMGVYSIPPNPILVRGVSKLFAAQGAVRAKPGSDYEPYLINNM